MEGAILNYNCLQQRTTVLIAVFWFLWFDKKINSIPSNGCNYPFEFQINNSCAIHNLVD